MRSNSILVRNCDKKEFRVTFLSHWSEIQAEDGETDNVKWYGGGLGEPALYVSANKGFTYTVSEGFED